MNILTVLIAAAFGVGLMALITLVVMEFDND